MRYLLVFDLSYCKGDCCCNIQAGIQVVKIITLLELLRSIVLRLIGAKELARSKTLHYMLLSHLCHGIVQECHVFWRQIEGNIVQNLSRRKICYDY